MTSTDPLFHSCPLPMWVFDTKTLYFLAVNTEAVSIYGYTEAEFLTMTIDQIRVGEIQGDIIRHVKKNGEVIFVQARNKAVHYEGTDASLAVITDVTARIQAESNLKLSEQRFKALVQDGSDMISILSADFKYVYLSPASLKFYHAESKPDLLIGTYAIRNVHELDRGRLVMDFSGIYDSPRIQIAPFRVKDMTGEYRWVETIITNLLDDPAINGILCSARDITDRIVNEEEMRLNAERYNIISKATSDTIWDWNLIDDEIFWNKGIKGIFGYKDLVDNTTSSEWWRMQVHPDDRERVWNNIQHHIRDRILRWQDEYRFACADGSYRYVLDRGFMVLDKDGVSVRMIGSMQDISLRKQEEQWSRLLESVVINATDAVLICTGNVEGSGQSIIYVNEAFTRMSGYNKYELIGASPRISQGPETDINEIRRLKDAIENKVPCEIEVINYTKQGREYWVSQSNAPIADSSGTVTHWISIQRDITQNKKHLKEIEEQNKKFKEIAWIQSHLVRAPLARVMGLVDLLKDFVPGDDKDELLLHLTTSAKELDAIIINIADKTPESEI
jgi:PAS domain S-box-containing protein